MAKDPEIGTTVEYHSYGTPGGEYTPQPRAAIITAVGPDKENGVVSLAILNPTGLFFDLSCRFSAEPKPGHWSFLAAERTP